MKILSGYDNKYKTDYRAKAAEEVDQLRRKADLLREMLVSVSEGETIGQGDVFEVIPPLVPFCPYYYAGSVEVGLMGRIWRYRLELLRQSYRRWLRRRSTMSKQ
jgi:hypothetical protein